MTTEQKIHPADLFAPFLDRYEALGAMIDEDTDPMQARELLEAISEGFRTKLDEIAGVPQ